MVNIPSSNTQSMSALQFLKPPHILILEARFYTDVADMLLEGALKALTSAHTTHEKISVPGALEIPVALQFASQRKNGRAFDAYVVLGTVVRGDTTHYETVCNESNRGLMSVAITNNLAVGNGILTVETLAQAIERADPAQMDKGGGAARAALTMLHLKQICGLAS
jgi:6,7-dimethyl-8-ribityllumazine synthase